MKAFLDFFSRNIRISLQTEAMTLIEFNIIISVVVSGDPESVVYVLS